VGDKEPREHGLIFGRGDDLGEDVEPPPMASQAPVASLGIPGYSPPPIPFGDPPPEPVTIEGEIPWELRDDPSTDREN
jgi:hypothetical protein